MTIVLLQRGMSYGYGNLLVQNLCLGNLKDEYPVDFMQDLTILIL